MLPQANVISAILYQAPGLTSHCHTTRSILKFIPSFDKKEKGICVKV